MRSMRKKVEPAATEADDLEPRLVAYLRAHPDFFQRHPELLGGLHLSHDSGDAVSLVERQVRTLREQNEEYRRRIGGLIQVAQQNEEVEQRLHRLTLGLLEGLSAPVDPVALRSRLQQEFELEVVELRLFPDHDPGDYQDLLAERQPRCGRLGNEPLRLLFGPQATEIRSSALVPLFGVQLCGLLAFGSRDEHRYQPGLGTDYLARLGELVTKALEVAPLPA
jgi:uncharacterized protein